MILSLSLLNRTKYNRGTKMIEKILAERLNIDAESISDDSNIVEDLGADSLSVVEIVMDIENEFDISIPDEDAEGLHTVGQLKEWLDENMLLLYML